MREGVRSIRIDGERCQGRMACMHVCPTQAIRVRDRKARLLQDRCIDCGECVRVCPSNAILPRTGSVGDFSAFKYRIALPSPVVYSQFSEAAPPAAVLEALRKVGFDDACDAAGASESVSIAIEEHLERDGTPRPLISPFCPAIVRLIQIRYPNLLDHLIPIESPMEIAAREAKRAAMKEKSLKENEIGVIYITPCPAKMIAIKHPPRKRHSFVNGAIAISEIFPTLHQALHGAEPPPRGDEVRGLGLGWPILGGQIAPLKEEHCLAVAGLSEAIRILEEIENGKLRDIQYIEVQSCPTGCVGGPLTVENAYIARGRVLRMVARYGSNPSRHREEIRELYQKQFFSLPGTIPSFPIQPLDEDMGKALEKLRQKQQLLEELPRIDCGACGSPTCATFAEDVIRKEAEKNECVFVAINELEEISARPRKRVTQHRGGVRRLREGHRP